MPILRSEITAYFEDLATRNKSIAHVAQPGQERFFQFKIGDINNNLRSDLKEDEAIMVLEVEETRYRDNNSDNAFQYRNCAIMILLTINPRHDKDQERSTKIDQAESIARQFIARIKRDSNQQKNPNWPIKKFDINKIFTHEVPKIYSNRIGCRFTFPIEEPAKLIVNQNDWT